MRTQLEMPEEQRNAFLKEKTACIISEDLAETLHLKIGDRVVLQGDIYPVNLDLTVRGIFSDPDAQSSLFFNMAYLRDALPVGQRDRDGTVAILSDSPESVPRIARQIDTMFEESPEQTKTESEQQFTLSFVSFLGNIKLFLLSICAAVTFTILLVSGNTMAMSVRERIKEVGVLKTLGFTNDTILAIIIGEALTIALIGGAIGIVLAGFLDVGVGKAGQAMMSQLHGLTVTPLIAAISLGVALLIGLISSFFPAWNAARTDILDSLRYSG
jgi:putative ABC transport system permease protein